MQGGGARAEAIPGAPVEIAGIVLTLRPDGLPDEFTIEVVSRQDAVQRTLKALGVDRAAGSVAELTYRDLDPYTSASVWDF